MRMDKIIQLQDRGLQDVAPLQFGEEQCPYKKSGVSAVGENYLMHYIYAGRGYYTAAGQTYTVTAGQVFIVHPHETVYYEPDHADPWHYCWVEFATRLDIPRLKTEYVLDAHYAEHIFRALSATDELMFGREYYVSGKILEFLSTLARPGVEASRKTFVDRAVMYIRKNYTHAITIEELAEYLGVSHSYLSTMFRRQMGVSPHQYLMDVRLENAAALMAEHGYSVSEAALSAGYGNVYNFSKMFKKKYGVSPRQYTQTAKEGQEKNA